MAKVTEKTSIKAPKKAAKSKSDYQEPIAKACAEALKKLKALDTDQKLQDDIEWCLGSYSYDKNPVGLYEMGERSLKVFRELKEKNPKAINAKLITDLEKALSSREV